MTPERLALLAADIKKNGQREEIVLIDGEDDVLYVLDGGNRQDACGLAGVEPNYEKVHIPVRDLPSFVLSKNFHRRDLSESQRGQIADSFAKLSVGRPVENKPRGLISSTDAPPVMTQAEAAKALNVSQRTVGRASAIRKVAERPDASPEEKALPAAVKEGKITLKEAEKVVRASRPSTRKASAPKPKSKPVAKPSAEQKRMDFFVRADHAVALAGTPFEGEVDAEVVRTARTVADIWAELADKLEKRLP